MPYHAFTNHHHPLGPGNRIHPRKDNESRPRRPCNRDAHTTRIAVKRIADSSARRTLRAEKALEQSARTQRSDGDGHGSGPMATPFQAASICFM